MNFGSVFSGIGGLDYGLELAGMTCRWQCENNPFCLEVLNKHWPAVKKVEDVRDLRIGSVEAVDLVCGGFPCQPVSLAGKREVEADSRWLWPEFARVLDAIRPRFALLENVPGILTAGGAGVVSDLASLGYDAEWDCIPASAVGAWHRRDRWFLFAADAASDGRIERWTKPAKQQRGHDIAVDGESLPFATDTDSKRQSRGEEQNFIEETGQPTSRRRNPMRRVLCNADGSGLEIGKVFGENAKGELATLKRTNREPGGCFDREALTNVRGTTDGVPHRVDRLRGLGNAVVPQVAYFIGTRIMTMSM